MDTNQVEGPDPRNDLSHFAREILTAKMQANAGLNGQPNPQRARVESSFSASPMTPARFEAPKGRTPGAKPPEEPAAAALATGAFYGQYVNSTTGDTYLQGGTVSGGTGNTTISDIKIIDSGTGDPVHAAGQHMYIEATGKGVTADGVLLPGWNLSTATIGYGATVPDNTLPTASSSSSKKCYVDLGVFTADAFLPAQAGNVQISFCPGSYTVSR